jgi:hypothetical protein
LSNPTATKKQKAKNKKEVTVTKLENQFAIAKASLSNRNHAAATIAVTKPAAN